jgi:ethanolamine phosphate transferase 2 subunit G
LQDTVEVDNNVTRHIDHELSNKNDWDVMILHYLGLDHIGHSAGPDSPLLPPKLLEMDIIFNRMFEFFSKDPETLFVMCGDHGMSEVRRIFLRSRCIWSAADPSLC